MSKFAVFLFLAGVLAILFALVPDRQSKVIHSEIMQIPLRDSGKSEEPLPAKAVVGDQKLGKSQGEAARVDNNFSTKVKVPAIRGMNNYGWVELPRGTRVSFVRENGNRLWVRWDGTVVEVPNVVATSGAIVVR